MMKESELLVLNRLTLDPEGNPLRCFRILTESST